MKMKGPGSIYSLFQPGLVDLIVQCMHQY